jgi:hypothetical protein
MKNELPRDRGYSGDLLIDPSEDSLLLLLEYLEKIPPISPIGGVASLGGTALSITLLLFSKL